MSNENIYYVLYLLNIKHLIYTLINVQSVSCSFHPSLLFRCCCIFFLSPLPFFLLSPFVPACSSLSLLSYSLPASLYSHLASTPPPPLYRGMKDILLRNLECVSVREERGEVCLWTQKRTKLFGL